VHRVAIRRLAPFALRRAGLGHLADARPEVRVAHQLGQLNPRLDLLGRRLIRQLGQPAA
jgi:hypothetical protein